MAVMHSGAQAAPTTSRTKRLHGVFPIGDARLVVVSSRRSSEPTGITIAAGDTRPDGSLRMITAGCCAPAMARLLARALLEAADAVDAAQRFARRSA